MDSSQTGRLYDQIAGWLIDQHRALTSGHTALQSAISLVKRRGKALDVGCGCGRLTPLLLKAGFDVTGVDVSTTLLDAARENHPKSHFIEADVCRWSIDQHYDLIVAWDSTFHVPHASQRDVTAKLCDALAPGGVLVFTAGGIDGEITGEMQGRSFYYSSLADDEYLRIVNSRGCKCVVMERDQHPENHVVFTVVKT
jgi:SAM-dependent methyltransferase